MNMAKKNEGLDTAAALKLPFVRQSVESATFAAVAELVRATEKFPKHPRALTSMTLSDVRCALSGIRHRNGDLASTTAGLIFLEEFDEMIEASLLGDLTAARAECIQCIAMLLRIYVHLPTYCTLSGATPAAAAEQREGGEE